MIKYSIIVPYHSNKNLLSVCMNALNNALEPSDSEIIIVDNNSTGSQMLTTELPIQTKVISCHKNLMYPRAINLGAEAARGEILLFCDADTCVTKGFNISLSKALVAEDVGFAAPKLIHMQTGNLLEFGITSSSYNFPHPFAGRPVNYKLTATDHYPLAACAACSAIRRNLFYEMNGFDTTLVHSYSDIDLCIRLFERGYKTICVADAYAYHCGSSTIGSGMGSSSKEDTKGIFMSKHPSIPIQISQYIEQSCEYLNESKSLHNKDYFLFDCSTIIDTELYTEAVIDRLNINIAGRYSSPCSHRDSTNIDFLNYIPYQIRNYKIPILYFVDSFLAFQGNSLWKACRKGYKDLVIDRHANIEWLHNI